MKGRAPLSSPRNRRRVRADPSHVNLQANDVWVQQRQDALGHCKSKGKAPDVRGQAGRICFQKQPGSTSGLPALTGLKPDYRSAVAEENSLVNDYRATKQNGTCYNGWQASDFSKWGQVCLALVCTFSCQHRRVMEESVRLFGGGGGVTHACNCWVRRNCLRASQARCWCRARRAATGLSART